MTNLHGQELSGLYSADELKQMLGSVGANVAVSRSVVFYSPKSIHLGSDIRIDCFSVLSGGPSGIVIEDHVHISTYVFLAGSSGKIHLEAFAGVASRTTIYTGTDDFVEGFITGPTVPDKYRKVRTGDVVLKRHALVGSGCVVLPDVTIGLGASVGALSLVNKDVPEFAVVAGQPIRQIGQRNRRILELEKEFLDEKQKQLSESQP
jgi:acetyltransferase-like isoleucine patch superfamily enzyme